MTIERLIRNAEELQEGMGTDAVLGDVLRQDYDSIINAQYLQLFQGKDNEGNDLRPYYSEDLKPTGYFNSRESAMRYAMWKRWLDYPVQAQRNTDAPNLYINGRFHSELQVGFFETAVGVIPQTMYASQIVSKYGIEKFGLSRDNWNMILNNNRKKIIERMKEILYG